MRIHFLKARALYRQPFCFFLLSSTALGLWTFIVARGLRSDSPSLCFLIVTSTNIDTHARIRFRNLCYTAAGPFIDNYNVETNKYKSVWCFDCCDYCILDSSIMIANVITFYWLPRRLEGYMRMTRGGTFRKFPALYYWAEWFTCKKIQIQLVFQLVLTNDFHVVATLFIVEAYAGADK